MMLETWVSMLLITNGTINTTWAMIISFTVNSSFHEPKGPTPEKSI